MSKPDMSRRGIESDMAVNLTLRDFRIGNSQYA